MMSPARHRRLMELLDHACELPAGAVPRFLAELADADVDVKPTLEKMLEADRRTNVLQTRGGETALANDLVVKSFEEKPLPAVLGGFEVGERLGAGAMGAVYLARQQVPSREVALKVLHPWLLSTRAVERFRFEAQALAALQHPSIPPIYAVVEDAGHLALAMQVVKGTPLLEHAVGLDVDGRLELLARIAEAVHHAHLRGLVHRDLKPDNLRVNGDGVPQVLDFGIAAALGDEAREVAGTPAYMSPEQVQPGAVVDVRSDVFSLGLIALEVLTGRLPAVPPKSGLQTLLAFKEAPLPVSTGLDDDVDFVVRRAVRVSPADRYGSAAELAEDLRRVLRREPLSPSTRAPTRAYVVSRFVQRHRLPVALAAAAVTALVAGVVVSTSQYLEARRERDRAEAEARRAQQSLDFMFSVMSEANPELGVGRGRGLPIGDVLDRASKSLDARTDVDARVATAARTALSTTWLGIGEYDQAAVEGEKAVAAWDAAKLGDEEQLARALAAEVLAKLEVGRGSGALPQVERAAAIEQKLHGGALHPHVAEVLNLRALAVRAGAKFAEAAVVHEQAIRAFRELGGEDRRPLWDALTEYGVTLSSMGRFEDAEAAHREALELATRQLGPDDLQVANVLHNLAWLMDQYPKPKVALELLDRALEIRLKKLGADHTTVGNQKNLEAFLRLELGDVKGARAAMDECLRITTLGFGRDSPRLRRMMEHQVLVLTAEGRTDEAIALGDAILAEQLKARGEDHVVTALMRSNVAEAYAAAGRVAEAKEMLEKAVAWLQPRRNARHRGLTLAQERLARLTSASARP
ncbi:MAG: serine/threonine protein kinase [Myxococcaceae bacterium]|nr:serine/threonine protein kinase [Myxococcaceae bacterium]